MSWAGQGRIAGRNGDGVGMFARAYNDMLQSIERKRLASGQQRPAA